MSFPPANQRQCGAAPSRIRGFHNDLNHLAATPLGAVVTVTATLTKIDGKRLSFAIDGHDEAGQIVGGIHERYVVRLDEFLASAGGGGPP